jgi:precorrin-6B methylase 2
VHTQGAVVVRLDPGLAFGTGTHATTAMCLAWLDEHAREGQVVIDYGCGSGVLAVAASKLGARTAYAYDIDPQALTATRDNAAANHVVEQVRVVESDDALPKGADILLANILCGPLCDLAPRFADLTAPGGKIVLAGLLEAQADEAHARTRRGLISRHLQVGWMDGLHRSGGAERPNTECEWHPGENWPTYSLNHGIGVAIGNRRPTTDASSVAKGLRRPPAVLRENRRDFPRRHPEARPYDGCLARRRTVRVELTSSV